MIITFFDDYGARRKRERQMTPAELAALVRETSAASKAALPWLKLARFGEVRTVQGSLRHNANVLAISGILVDYDGERVSFDEAVECLDKAGITAVVYTSPSHNDERPRWRVGCPFSAELPPTEHNHMVARVNGLLGGVLAPESFVLSQSYFYGAVNRNPAHRVEIVDGTVTLDCADELDEIAIGRPNGSHNGVDHVAGEPQAEISDIVAALSVIPNDDRPWDGDGGWNYVGMAVWRASGGLAEGLAAFLDWSRKSAKFDASETEFKWRHYADSPPDKLGFGTLVFSSRARSIQTGSRLPGGRGTTPRRSG